ncbi:hypothetical protein GGI20_001005 [Coemansia sp. BCRC 34301]|nr:hypothetical protein GGI20_001005 [Coemansia sp. BCRC 34301]
MPLPPTPENILHKTLHDRFYIAKTIGERALLSLALQAFAVLKDQRQECESRSRFLLRDIQHTESQLSSLSSMFDRHIQGASKYTSDDARMMDSLGDRLAAQENRLRLVKADLADAEQRFAQLVTAWATTRF